ncbi:GCG_CRPN prefix-to-repeats domain-containing protein [Methylobacterium nigriterrae]|uniref:GCG_CRPN prefix-to-repeats domain-containing protein n=1 Tax=Methylobacterium nigriterrae TaxID=3127512 RepID=UPI003013E457
MIHAKTLGLAAAIAGGLGLATAVSAAPLAPAPLAAAGSDAMIERVAGGCGPGFHPNPWGVCRPNWGPRPYWRRPVVYGGPYGYGRPRPYYRPYGAYYGPRPFY